jgi:hypothetical protein
MPGQSWNAAGFLMAQAAAASGESPFAPFLEAHKHHSEPP